MPQAYFLIQLNGQYYGIRNDQVSGVVTEFGLQSVPAAPAWFEGILKVRNECQPLISFESLLRSDLSDFTNATRSRSSHDPVLILLAPGDDGRSWPFAVRVDAVLGPRTFEDHEILSAPKVSRGESPFVSSFGFVEQRTFSLLDLSSFNQIFKRLLFHSDRQLADSQNGSFLSEGGPIATFFLGNSEWAAPLKTVLNSSLLEGLIQDSLMPSFALGAIVTEGGRIPVLDLRQLYAAEPGENEEGSCVFFNRTDGFTVGYAVSTLGRIDHFSPSDRLANPFLRTLIGQRNFSHGFVCTGGRILELVEPDLLIDFDNLQRLRTWKSALDSIDRLAVTRGVLETKEDLPLHHLAKEISGLYVIAKSDGLLVALPAEAVIKIVPEYRLVPLPGVKGSTRNMYPYRGKACPVMDLAEHLELRDTVASNEPASHNKTLLIATIEDELFGVEVDEVINMLTLDARDISDKREIRENVYPKLIRASAQTQVGLAAILDLQALFDDREVPLNRRLRKLFSPSGQEPTA